MISNEIEDRVGALKRDITPRGVSRKSTDKNNKNNRDYLPRNGSKSKQNVVGITSANFTPSSYNKGDTKTPSSSSNICGATLSSSEHLRKLYNVNSPKQ
jgi:hypothetical protein